MTSLLSIDGLDVQIAGREIVHEVRLGLSSNEVVAVMGPNGCGKSTILRTVYRALRPAGGTILLEGEDLLAMPFRRSAQQVAALAQESASDLDFTVEETVAMGRIPHSGGRLNEREKRLCEQALEDLGIAHLRTRGMLGLSGGERQRVLIARALVQEPQLLILDEPTNHLDIAHQLRLLSLLQRLEIGVLVVLHDLNLAAAVCDRLHFMRAGRLVASGTPTQLITEDRIREVFDAEATVVPHPLTGAPQVLRRGLASTGQDAARIASWSPFRSYAAARLWAQALD